MTVVADAPRSGARAPDNRCPVCAHAVVQFFATAWDSGYVTSPERFSYWRCADCDAVFLGSPPTDRLAEIYPKTHYSFTGGADSFAMRIKKWLDGCLFRRILRRIPGDALAVLDVGGGSGWLLSVIRAQDARVGETHEVDLDESARAAAERAGHVFHRGPIEAFVSDRRFDLVVLLNIVEHVADPADLLRRMAKLLTDGGLILVKTPNTDTLDRRLFQHRNWSGFHCPRHWVLFTRRTFLTLAERSGLECVWARYTQGAPQWTNSVLGWLADRGLITVTTARPMHTHPLHPPFARVDRGARLRAPAVHEDGPDADPLAPARGTVSRVPAGPALSRAGRRWAASGSAA